MSVQRTTWADLKNQIGQPTGMCGDSPELLNLVNEGGAYFWGQGDWLGKHCVYRLRIHGDCHGNRCVTWPNPVEAIEAMNICGQQVGVRNIYFAFLAQVANAGYSAGANWGNGLNWGIGLNLLGDKQEVFTSEDFGPTNGYLRVFTERIESSGSIIFFGYDVSGNWIRTQDGSGVWRDGVYLALADLTGTGITTPNLFSNFTGVQFTNIPRNGNVYLYHVDELGNQRQLATYDYSMKVPVFRRSILNCLPRHNEQSACATILARMRWQNILSDTDFVQISSVSAWKEILMYLRKRDTGKISEAEAHKQEAINILNAELKQFNGFGAKRVFNWGPRQVYGAATNLQ